MDPSLRWDARLQNRDDRHGGWDEIRVRVEERPHASLSKEASIQQESKKGFMPLAARLSGSAPGL